MSKAARALTAAETRLVQAAAAGEDLTLTLNDNISAALIYDLCTGRYPGLNVHPRGLRLNVATIDGILDFSGAVINVPLYLTRCNFSSDIILKDARARTISFEESTIARLSGERCEVAGALAFTNCKISDTVRLHDAAIGVLNFDGAHIKATEECALRANRLNVRGSLFFRKAFRSEGGISLEDARIGGRLDFSEAVISCNGGDAIYATGLDLKGMLNFDQATVTGRIRLVAALVGGVALFRKCTLNNAKEIVIRASGAQFKSAVLFDEANCTGVIEIAFASIAATLECRNSSRFVSSEECLRLTELKTAGSIILGSSFEGMVDLQGARIGGDVDIGPAQFKNAGKDALYLGGAAIQSSLLVEDTEITGAINLKGARISNSLEFRGVTCIQGDILAEAISVQAHVSSHSAFNLQGAVSLLGAHIGGAISLQGKFKNSVALKAAQITGAVDFSNCSLGDGLQAEGVICKTGLNLGPSFSCSGMVTLAGAQISGDFSARNAVLNHNGFALNLDNANIDGEADCSNMQVAGAIRLRNAEISGDLRFSGSQITGVDGKAIRAAGCVVKSSLFLNNGLNATGGIRLSRARVTGVLHIVKAKVVQTDPEQPALRCQGMDVQGRFDLRQSDVVGEIALSGASVGLLGDDTQSWPTGAYNIENFSYEGLAGTMSPEERLGWLRSQKGFNEQSYEQAAKVLRSAGFDRQARNIARARRDDLRKTGNLSDLRRISNWVLSVTIGHGYQLWRVLIPALILAVAGTFVFASAQSQKALVAQDDKKPVPFVAAMYSIDNLVPIVNFHQKDNFRFAEGAPHVFAYQSYFWFHTFMGWLLSTLLVAGLSGVTRRD